MTRKWVSVVEACHILRISKSTLYRQIQQGTIQSRKEGKTTLCLVNTSDESQNETLETQIETDETQQFVEQLQKENDDLKQQIEYLKQQSQRKDDQIEKLQEQVAEASHRHDTVVMQMTRLLEYHQQPFWRRWRKRKQLPEATIGEEEQ